MIILSYFLRSRLSHKFQRKMWLRWAAGTWFSKRAVATQGNLHLAATRAANAGPEPSSSGMHARMQVGSKMIASAEEADEQLSLEEESKTGAFDLALCLPFLEGASERSALVSPSSQGFLIWP